MKLKKARLSDIYSPDDFDKRYVKPRQGRTLVVGSFVYPEREDRRARYSQALGADMREGPGVDMVLDLEETLPWSLGKFSHVDCLSVLEHSRRPWLLAANVERLLDPGGTLYVCVPFVWRIHDKPYDLWRFTVDGVRILFPGIDWSVIRYVNQTGIDALPVMRSSAGLLYFERCEVCGFGVKR